MKGGRTECCPLHEANLTCTVGLFNGIGAVHGAEKMRLHNG